MKFHSIALLTAGLLTAAFPSEAAARVQTSLPDGCQGWPSENSSGDARENVAQGSTHDFRQYMDRVRPRVSWWTGATAGIVAACLGAGADLMARDELGSTPLHYAADGASAEAAKTLISAGANLVARNEYGQTPLHYAAAVGSAEVVETLLAAGADPDLLSEHGVSPLSSAAWGGDAGVVKVLTDSGADPSIGTFGVANSPLAAALDRGGLSSTAEVVRLLLAAGADVNAWQEGGRTHLHRVVQFERLELVQLLLAAGADPNARSDVGDTPLHSWAAFPTSLRRKSGVVGALLDAGADARARNAEGETPWDLLQRNPHLDAVKGSDDYWRLNDARFDPPTAREAGEAKVP